jgi:hypothetical protein
VPHRYCQNHFLRDLAKPMLEADSHAKVQMRKKVRGLRAIEREVLDDRRKAQEASDATASARSVSVASEPAASGVPADVAPADVAVGQAEAVSPPAASEQASAAEQVAQPAAGEAGQVVLDYCSAVRGILNDDQGGPLHPPGIRMAEALQEVAFSLQRNLDAKKGGAARSSCAS